MTTKQDIAKDLAASIKAAGFRVFLSGNGEYGIYTDAEGSRVVSFSSEYGMPKFSGNYTTSAPRHTGTGWRLRVASFTEMFNEIPGSWAVGSATWKYTTLKQHLDTYQSSSKYTEI